MRQLRPECLRSLTHKYCFVVAAACLHAEEAYRVDVQMQQEVWQLPVAEHGGPKGERRDLHLLRAQLRNVRCVNGPHGAYGAYYVPPGLQLPCQMLVGSGGGRRTRAADTPSRVQAELWHAIKQSSHETQVTLQRLREFRAGQPGCRRSDAASE